jgi:hypothetical protein
MNESSDYPLARRARVRAYGRTFSKTVVFTKPFLLKGIDRMLPAGDYRVVTDEELIEGISFPGHHPSRW